MDTKKRLEELRAILRSESMSYDELHELQDFGERGLIEPDDVELLEAAGVPEQRKGDMDTRKLDIRTVSHLPRDFAKHGRYHLTINEKVANGHGPDLMRAVGSKDGEAVAAELVRRWNAHLEQQNMLRRLAEKVRRANSIQHSGGKVDDEDWSELHGLSNEAFALLETLKTN